MSAAKILTIQVFTAILDKPSLFKAVILYLKGT